ncbi:hypothetical protein [Methanimicrococcus blatticola]|uniref:Uncharacterized protein n=1 Tax=Methanimicrococcus blatticola TaxID=91560 RepID=A0A484F5V6_9EURY|nr:hypothetical protein [Methanimicrococcus blatticola]MBZ3936189.1 hypothetical protein [Methanimicrococcus blatticola]MCC2508432.1 hypothetical protein [Methanimicrococcus blatticola]TDQ70115.1 hypothetical protein C7391_0453 [Methanimicrococcus blatticola]
MPDVIILWDSPLFFEHMFQEYGISSTVAAPASLNSPHLPPAKLLVVPTGFTYPEHAAVSNALADEKIQKKIFNFVENGGALLMFSPLKEVSTCSACRVPAVTSLTRFGLDAEYVQTDILLSRSSPLTGDSDSVYCDGYFQNIGGNFSVIEKDDDGKPVHIAADFGKGKIILSTIHEFLSKTYFESLLSGSKVKL